ncbi:MAG: hypothetical protein KGI75_20010 [Rhizobiaceae bacterium]|nr:hypothetical protein [Rhizobiaceae bacterium]
MASKAVLFLAAAAAGVGFLVFSKKSSASPAQSNLPEGWNPPSGATFVVLPKSNPTTLALNVWKWRDPAALGETLLVANAANPKTDWVGFFSPDANPKQLAILTRGTTPNSGLIAQAGVAGLLT